MRCPHKPRCAGSNPAPATRSPRDRHLGPHILWGPRSFPAHLVSTVLGTSPNARRTRLTRCPQRPGRRRGGDVGRKRHPGRRPTPDRIRLCWFPSADAWKRSMGAGGPRRRGAYVHPLHLGHVAGRGLWPGRRLRWHPGGNPVHLDWARHPKGAPEPPRHTGPCWRVRRTHNRIAPFRGQYNREAPSPTLHVGWRGPFPLRGGRAHRGRHVSSRR